MIKEEHYCDLCGEKITRYANLVIPRRHINYATGKNGIRLAKIPKETIDEIETCPKCVRALTFAIELVTNPNVEQEISFNGDSTVVNYRITI